MSNQKISIIQASVSALLYIAAHILEDGNALFLLGDREINLSVILLLAAYLVSGISTIKDAVYNLFHGQLFDENFLMTVASIGAFCLGEYEEAAGVMIFYKVGSAFEGYAVNRSRRSIAELMKMRPEYANIVEDGEITVVEPEDVKPGDIILIKAGERIPLDGVVIEGESEIDTSPITGESVPRYVSLDDDILSGCVNLEGALKVRVTSCYEESTVAKVLELVEEASDKKAPMEKFITKFSRIYTPVVCGAALILALVPPLFIQGQTFETWVYRALVFLVISCPCALVISIPLSFFGGIGAASREGILVKGSNYLEALTRAETIIFDKTGTITTGTFGVINIMPYRVSVHRLLELAAFGECFSNHPVSDSIKKAGGVSVDVNRISDAREIAGEGTALMFDERRLLTGNEKLLKRYGIAVPAENSEVGEAAAVVHVAYDGKYCGSIALADTIKSGVREMIENIKREGVKSTIMLTGDRSAIAESVALQTGIDTAYGQLLPGDKVTLAEHIIEEKSTKGKVVFVGDGINDAPVIARADVGIAMGGIGAEAAVEAADIVIMDDDASKIHILMRIARRTMNIAIQNVVFALGVKAVVLVLGAFGIASMWLAVFADVGVSMIAIMNSMRALILRKQNKA